MEGDGYLTGAIRLRNKLAALWQSFPLAHSAGAVNKNL